jgi:hypothetical protein
MRIMVLAICLAPLLAACSTNIQAQSQPVYANATASGATANATGGDVTVSTTAPQTTVSATTSVAAGAGTASASSRGVADGGAPESANP